MAIRITETIHSDSDPMELYYFNDESIFHLYPTLQDEIGRAILQLKLSLV